jgi:hypothetical protein
MPAAAAHSLSYAGLVKNYFAKRTQQPVENTGSS